MVTAPLARRPPYPLPPRGAPLRLAFVGQSTFFRACALGDELAGVRTTFIDFRKDDDAERMRAAVEAFAPHAVIAFRPEIVPAGLFAGLRAPILGFLTEPLPRTMAGEIHEDLGRRLWELEHVDPTNFDRVVSFDPHIAETATAAVPVWRSLPIPVADRYYGPVRPMRTPPRALFVGRSTPHREWMLRLAKHDFDVVHYAFGVDADDLEALMAEHEVAINVHNQRYQSFENRVCLHLAAGHLVLTEPLSPRHGLEAGLDYVEIDTPDLLHWQLEHLSRFPALHHRVRVRGRQKAEQYRASRVYPRLVADLFADVAAFGSARSPA
jgi:hypothetical protein